MNTDLKKKQKMILKKIFLMNNAVFGKTMENLRKNGDIKLVATEKRKNYLVSEPNYHTTKFFTENILAIEMKTKAEIIMSKPVYLGLSILELSKILMHEFWYHYVKPKYDEKAKLCYMHANSFVVYIKTNDIYRDIAENVETKFDTSNYELECNSIERSLAKEKTQKHNWINER